VVFSWLLAVCECVVRGRRGRGGWRQQQRARSGASPRLASVGRIKASPLIVLVPLSVFVGREGVS